MRLFLLVVLSSRALYAHAGEPPQPHDLCSAWSFDVFVVAGLAISASLFALGARRTRGILRWEIACYWAGWLVLLLALVSPVHALGEALFSAHMLQHELMMVVAAPLLVLGRPLVSYLWALPQGMRKTLGAWSQQGSVRSSWGFLSNPLHAWWLHFVALWGWHIPALFQATLESDLVHSAQHLSFFLSALLFWWSLIRRQGKRKEYGRGAFYIFTTMIHTGALGALLTFSTAIWYPAYKATTQPWGLTPLEDQQLGGLLMTVPPVAVYLAAFLVLFGIWVRDSDQRYRSSITSLAVACVFLSSCGRQPDPKVEELLAGANAEHGRTLIQYYGCPSCHTIPGIKEAVGQVGPPLTKISLRSYLAGRINNTPGNMVRWVMHPKSIDEKTAMPEMNIPQGDALDIVAFLQTIK